MTILHEAGVLKHDIEQAVDTLKDEIIPVDLQPAPALAEVAPSVEPLSFEDSKWGPEYLDLTTSTADFAPPVSSNLAGPEPVTVAPTPTPSAVRPPVLTNEQLAQTVQPQPQLVVQPEPTILSLENTAMVAPVPPAPISGVIAPTSSPMTSLPPPLTTTPPSGFQPPAPPNFPTPPQLNLRTKLQALLHNTPATAALAALTMVMLVGGIFAASKLVHQSSRSTPVASSQSDTALQADKTGILSLNLDTVVAKGKTLTVGQIVAGPGSSILQLAGDLNSSGSLLASGGTSSLNNSGLTINKTLVCTAAGCIGGTTGNQGLTALPATTTVQGNTFNGPSQLVQLTGAGLLPVLSGVNLSSLNGSNISFGTLADARLSSNVALLTGTGPQTFSGNNKFTGTFLAQNAANSTTAFAIQNAAGSSNLLIADTTNSRIAIAQATAAYTLDVNGDINSTTGVRVGGALLCSASGCTAGAGSSNYIQNSLNLQTANFNLQSIATTSVTGIIRAMAAQSADLLQLKDSAGTNVVTIGPTGNTLIQPSTNSTSAFQVFNKDATSHLIGGDTLNARVAIAKPTPPDYTLDVGGDINSTTGLRVAGNLVCSATCTPGGGSGNYIQNGIALQTANFAIQSDLNTHIGGLIRGASGQSADLLDLVAGDLGTNVVSFGASGATLFKNAADSTAAFQIQNVAANNYILVNASGASLSLGDTSIASTVQIGNTTGAVAQTINIGNNATAASATTVVLGSTIGTSPLTLQAGSTGITAKTTSTTAFVIQKADGTGTILTADTSGVKVTLGSASATPTILVLGVKNDNATDPICTAGAIYYNSTAAAFRGCQDIPSGFTNLGNPAGTILAYGGSSAPTGYLIADGSCVLRSTYATLFAVIGTTYSDNATVVCDANNFNLPDLRGRSAVGKNASQTTRTDVTALGKTEGAVIGSRTPYHKSTVVQPSISVTGNPTISVTGNPTISVTGNPTISISDPGHTHTINRQTITLTTGGPLYTFDVRDQATNTITSNSSTTGITASASGGSYSASGGSYSASGGSYSASNGTVGPQTNTPTDTSAYLTVNYIIKY